MLPQRAPVKYVKWYVPAGDKRYVFSFTSPAETFPYKLIEFEQIAKTIRMREPVPSKPGKPSDWSWAITIAGLALAVVCAVVFVFVARKQFRPATGE